MPNIFVLMTHHGHDDYTDLALKSLAKNTTVKFSVMVVDDASPVPYVPPEGVGPEGIGYENVDGIISNHPGSPVMSMYPLLKVVNLTERKGVTNAWNMGMRQWELTQDVYEYCVFTNNDVIFHKGWHEQLVECFDQHPDCGVAGPMSNQPGPCMAQHLGHIDANTKWDDPASFMRADHEKRGHPLSVGDDYINGFCFMLNKDRITQPRFKGVNFGGEEEYQQKMREEGLVGYACPESWVFHFKDVSFQTWRMGRLGMRERDLPRLKEGPPRVISEGPPTDPEAGLTYPGQPQSARS